MGSTWYAQLKLHTYKVFFTPFLSGFEASSAYRMNMVPVWTWQELPEFVLGLLFRFFKVYFCFQLWASLGFVRDSQGFSVFFGCFLGFLHNSPSFFWRFSKLLIWVSLSFSWFIITNTFSRFTWVFQIYSEFLWLSPSYLEFPWISALFPEFPRVSLDFCPFSPGVCAAPGLDEEVAASSPRGLL